MTKTPKGRALGKALRAAREDQGLTVRSFAKQLGRDPGVISRWETGDRTPRPEQVAQILTALGINGEQYEEIISLTYGPDDPSWVATTLPAQRQQLAALVDLEQQASKIIEVSPLMIPGLLQTSDYIRAIMSGGGVPASELATRIALRIGRREVIVGQQPADFITFVGESALRQVIGDPEIMKSQLDYLREMAERPNIDIRVIPFTSGWHPALEGPFLLIESEHAKVVHLENRKSGLFLHEDADVDIYQKAIEMVEKVSMSTSQSLALINKVTSELERPT